MKSIHFEEYGGPRLSRDAQLQRLRKVMDRELTGPQREVLIAYYFENLTMAQIAERRGVCRSTVSRTLERAECRVRRCLRY